MSDLGWQIDDELRQILVCPGCRGSLEDAREGLACRVCQILFPVVDDVPHMILEESRPFPTE